MISVFGARTTIHDKSWFINHTQSLLDYIDTTSVTNIAMSPQSSENLGDYDDQLPDAVSIEVLRKPEVWRLRIFIVILLLDVTTTILLLSPIAPK